MLIKTIKILFKTINIQFTSLDKTIRANGETISNQEQVDITEMITSSRKGYTEIEEDTKRITFDLFKLKQHKEGNALLVPLMEIKTDEGREINPKFEKIVNLNFTDSLKHNLNINFKGFTSHISLRNQQAPSSLRFSHHARLFIFKNKEKNKLFLYILLILAKFKTFEKDGKLLKIDNQEVSEISFNLNEITQSNPIAIKENDTTEIYQLQLSKSLFGDKRELSFSFFKEEGEALFTFKKNFPKDLFLSIIPILDNNQILQTYVGEYKKGKSNTKPFETFKKFTKTITNKINHGFKKRQKPRKNTMLPPPDFNRSDSTSSCELESPYLLPVNKDSYVENEGRKQNGSSKDVKDFSQPEKRYVYLKRTTASPSKTMQIHNKTGFHRGLQPPDEEIENCYTDSDYDGYNSSSWEDDSDIYDEIDSTQMVDDIKNESKIQHAFSKDVKDFTQSDKNILYTKGTTAGSSESMQTHNMAGFYKKDYRSRDDGDIKNSQKNLNDKKSHDYVNVPGENQSVLFKDNIYDEIGSTKIIDFQESLPNNIYENQNFSVSTPDEDYKSINNKNVDGPAQNDNILMSNNEHSGRHDAEESFDNGVLTDEGVTKQEYIPSSSYSRGKQNQIANTANVENLPQKDKTFMNGDEDINVNNDKNEDVKPICSVQFKKEELPRKNIHHEKSIDKKRVPVMTASGVTETGQNENISEEEKSFDEQLIQKGPQESYEKKDVTKANSVRAYDIETPANHEFLDHDKHQGEDIEINKEANISAYDNESYQVVQKNDPNRRKKTVKDEKLDDKTKQDENKNNRDFADKTVVGEATESKTKNGIGKTAVYYDTKVKKDVNQSNIEISDDSQKTLNLSTANRTNNESNNDNKNKKLHNNALLHLYIFGISVILIIILSATIITYFIRRHRVLN
ncbi:hypothetical protein CDIK_2330 [Cucumispora dikerogammari]|nr:hypothetical protein CDIK_2330 [Cucumispora dikerogammari]